MSRLNRSEFVQRVKIAIALIKNTPPEFSCEDYVSYLSVCSKAISADQTEKSSCSILCPRILGVSINENLTTPYSLQHESPTSNEECIFQSLKKLLRDLRSDIGSKLSDGLFEKCLAFLRRLLIKQSKLSNDVVEFCVDFVDEINQDIIHEPSVEELGFQQRRTKLISAVAEHPDVTYKVIAKLVSEISEFSTLHSELSAPDGTLHLMIKFENIYYIMHALECTLETALKRRLEYNEPPSSSEFFDMVKEFELTLQDADVNLNSKFPLFSTFIGQLLPLFDSLIS